MKAVIRIDSRAMRYDTSGHQASKHVYPVLVVFCFLRLVDPDTTRHPISKRASKRPPVWGVLLPTERSPRAVSLSVRRGRHQSRRR